MLCLPKYFFYLGAITCYIRQRQVEVSMTLDKEWLDLSKARHKVLNILELFDGIPVIDEDLDADYGPNDIDACLGLADLELRRVLRLIDGRLDNIAAIKQEEWREIGQAEMDAAR